MRDSSTVELRGVFRHFVREAPKPSEAHRAYHLPRNAYYLLLEAPLCVESADRAQWHTGRARDTLSQVQVMVGGAARQFDAHEGREVTVRGRLVLSPLGGVGWQLWEPALVPPARSPRDARGS